MFDLESVAHRMTHNLLKDDQMDTVQRAKVEYDEAIKLCSGLGFGFRY